MLRKTAIKVTFYFPAKCMYKKRGNWPYIKNVWGGRGRGSWRRVLWGPWNILSIYWWAMKYFWQFLIGHKKCSYVSLFLSFLVTSFKKLELDILKYKQNSLMYIWQMVVKIQKDNFLCIFKLMLRSASLAMGQTMHLYDKFSWEFFICLTPFYPE